VDIGVDLVAVARMERLLERFGDKALRRLFTPAERRYCLAQRHPARCFAGRFAAKEALLKALGTGLHQGLRWTDVAVEPDASGRPTYRLQPPLRRRLAGRTPRLSISHEKEYALAVCILSP